jgi:hypothetical protein
MQAVDTTQLQSETITTLKAETKTQRDKVLDTRLSLAAREADCWLLRQALREIEAEPEASPKVREQATASLIRVPDPYLYQQPKAEPKAGAGAESKADDENILATALAKSLAQGKL